jgi:hypothetical protein
MGKWMNLIEMSKKCQRTKARERERGIERIIRPTDSGCKEPVEGFSFGRKRQQQINTASLLCMCVLLLSAWVCVCVWEAGACGEGGEKGVGLEGSGDS